MYYNTRITIKSEANETYHAGIALSELIRSISIDRRPVDRKTAHAAVDEYFDEFDEMVECHNQK